MNRKVGGRSWKINRFLNNLSFKLGVFRLPRILTTKPSIAIMTVAMMTFAVFVLAGGVYSLVEIMSGRALTMIPIASGWTFVYPGNLNMQTINESLISGMLYFLGAMGFYLVLRSARLTYRPRQAYLTLIIGLMLVLLVVYYSSAILQSKVTA